MLLSVGNTLLVLTVGWLWLRERPGRWQAVGILLGIGGAALFYYPWNLGTANLLGIGMILLSGTGYAVHLTANRALISRGSVDTLSLVLYPMAVGAATMLILGLTLEPWPGLTWKLAGLLLWLGPVNGALAFFLWTASQKGLQAFESSALNNSMLLQVAAMDALFLGGRPGAWSLLCLLTAGTGIMLVQAAGRRQTGQAQPGAPAVASVPARSP